MKKAIVLLMVGIMSLSLGACGSTSSETSSAESAEVSSDVAAEESSDEEIEATEEEENTTESEESEATEINLGDTVDLDFVSVRFDSFVVSDGWEFSYSDSSSGIKVTNYASIDCTSGMKLVCLVGEFTSKASSDIYTGNNPIYGKMIIDGNEYHMSCEGWNTAEAEHFLTIVPQQTVELYFYAEVPENVANSIGECEIQFGFTEGMEFNFVDDVEDLDYIYCMKATPTVNE